MRKDDRVNERGGEIERKRERERKKEIEREREREREEEKIVAIIVYHVLAIFETSQTLSASSILKMRQNQYYP